MNLAILTFDELQILVKEISDKENVKVNIVNILDDAIFYTSSVVYDLQSEKNKKNSLLGFSNGKIKKQNFYGMH